MLFRRFNSVCEKWADKNVHRVRELKANYWRSEMKYTGNYVFGRFVACVFCTHYAFNSHFSRHRKLSETQTLRLKYVVATSKI